jgi:hypothetical protein
MIELFVSLLISAVIPTAQAQSVYKCTGADGQIVYSYTPCPGALGTAGQAVDPEPVLSNRRSSMSFSRGQRSSRSVMVDGECLRKVFDRYCLGAPIEEIMREHPGARMESGTLILEARADGAVAGAVGADRLAGVLKMHEPARWMNYLKLRGKLEEIYGRPEDRSYFPAHADTESSRETAIRIGAGEVRLVWPQPDGWDLMLHWAGRDYINVFYIHNLLWDQVRTGDQY